MSQYCPFKDCTFFKLIFFAIILFICLIYLQSPPLVSFMDFKHESFIVEYMHNLRQSLRVFNSYYILI